ncbi:MAG: AAA family ATPase [Blastocatellia bacterium]|nr:AAA family ATPase [Blastocatellia bacterium]
MSKQMSLVILTGDANDAIAFRSALIEDRRVRIVSASDNPEQVYSDCIRWKPNAVIINLGAEHESAWTLCRQIGAVCPETVIICASHESSPDLILDSLRAGAREFLRLPILSEELRTVLDHVLEFGSHDMKRQKKRGRVISVFSNKGGCGTSFVAANLAIALEQPTVLVDLNLQASSQDLFFGVRPKFSIVDMVQNRARMDDKLLAGYLIECAPKLSLLAAPMDAEAAEDVRADHVVESIELLRERFDYIVLDLPHTFDAVTISALDQSDDILLVLTLDILSTRAAQRALMIFGRLGYTRERIRLVLNRWSKQSDLELRHVERFLGERIAGFISDDYKTVVNSINLGKPLVAFEPTATVVAEIRSVAALCGATKNKPVSEERKNFLTSFLSSVRRPSEPTEAGAPNAPKARMKSK